MIDHLSLGVTDLARARAFYDAALAPLGYKPIMQMGQMVGYGSPKGPQFWVSADGASHEQIGQSRGLHVAFRAADRTVVDAFYRAALEAGGRDNGAPGVRTRYHPDYYAAFVIDPDGYRIEAVCHTAHL
jgi:catechol 2,3-dioxygenase-like lactoylglutathione lyase family enzyme